MAYSWRSEDGFQESVCPSGDQTHMIRLTQKALLPTEQSSPTIFITLNDYFKEWKYNHSSNQPGMSTCLSTHPSMHAPIPVSVHYVPIHLYLHIHICMHLVTV